MGRLRSTIAIFGAVVIMATAPLPSSAQAQTPSPVTDQDAWEMLNQRIAIYLSGFDKDFAKHFLIQIPAAPVYTAWDKPEALFTLYEIGDGVPVWGPSWLPSNKKFSEGYEAFINAISLPEGTPAQAALKKKFADAQKVYSDESERLRQLWIKYDNKQRTTLPKASWSNRTQWYANHNAKLIIYQNEYSLAFGRYQQSLDANTRVVAQRIKAFYDAVNADIRLPASAQSANIDASDTTNWTTESVKPLTLDSTAYTALVTNGETQFQKAMPLYEWTLDATSIQRHEDRESWGANASYGYFFSGSAGSDTTSINVKTDGSNADIKFFGMAMVPIHPTQWYSEQLLVQYACGPFKPDAQLSPSTLWGSAGSLSAIPVAAILGYKPDLFIKLTHAQYDFYERHVNASGGFSYGPFHVGGSYSKTIQNITDDKQAGTVHVQNIAPTPVVLAVLYRKLPGKECH